MEGNIIIRQGDPNNGLLMREAHAEYATFDVRDNKALLLKAELETYLPSIQGTIRVWAERIPATGSEHLSRGPRLGNAQPISASRAIECSRPTSFWKSVPGDRLRCGGVFGPDGSEPHHGQSGDR